MDFVKGHKGSRNKVGGQPSYLPMSKPWSEDDDEYLGFLLELEVDNSRLVIPGAISIQFYQSIEEGDDPTPAIFVIKPNIPINDSRSVLDHPEVEEWDICFREADDPDTLPKLEPSLDFGRLFKSKLSGIDPWRVEHDDRVFLGQICESPVGFNFGGMLCSFYLLHDGRITIDLN